MKKDLDEYKDFCAEAVAATFEAQNFAHELICIIRCGSATSDTPKQ